MVNRHEPPDLMIVNLAGDLTAWQIARYLESTPAVRGTLVLVDRRPTPGLDVLTAFPGVECAERDDMVRVNAWLDSLGGKLAPISAPVGTLLPGSPGLESGIIGNSQQLREVLTKIDKVAGGDANVCIMGESGTGKELIARAIHRNSPRRDRPLVTLDCTAIPEGLMESQLFGHRRGSFTGAVEHRNGVFALADTGTLFIDEISELPLPLQAKLLRVIQAHEFVEVGGSQPIQTDIRLITASNKDLREATAGRARRKREVQGGPVLPGRRGDDPASSAPRAEGRYPAARPPLSRAVQLCPPSSGSGHHPPGAGNVDVLHVAR